jgi:FSR family fosmidomycin resistance protein-like MFS transporter
VAVQTLALLLIECLDELVFGAREAAWPLIQSELGLSYVQMGLLLGLPNVIGNLIELSIGVLADVWKRRMLVLGGGIAFTLALLLTATGRAFPILLGASILLSPASGAFVGLSQATLMDIEPARREDNMARWTFAGSVGVVLGPILLTATSAAGASWRWLFLLFGGLTLVLLISARKIPFRARGDKEEQVSFSQGMANALRALRRGEVIRWLTLLEFSDLMLDVLLGFLALYIVEVAGRTPTEAGIAVTVWASVGLLGDLLIIPLLRKMPGLTYLRASAVIELVLFTALLLVPAFWGKIALLALLGFFNAGWYAILKAQLYGAMPGQSGSVMTVGNAFGWIGGLIPIGLGLVADRFGLGAMMWLLIAGPVALLVGIPRENRTQIKSDEH